MHSLSKTLKIAHLILDQNQIPHALIGGIALASLGINRSTADVDLVALGERKDDIISLLTQAGFVLDFQSNDVLHFSGLGFLDILLAHRPISMQMLSNASRIGPEGVRVLDPEDIIGLKIQAYKNNQKRRLQDQADIQSLIENFPNMDWKKIQEYAELFSEWDEIQKIKASVSDGK